MECPFKLDSRVTSYNASNGHNYEQYHYQECAETGCRAWSSALNDCRLALMGMERVTQKSNGGG